MLNALLVLVPCFITAQEHEEPRVRQPLPSPDEIAALPPNGGSEFNRLIHEQSPYLLQHARNPVDWFPWGPEAFAIAARADKPIFLSIGYSTCHWCHVMEHESFEDPEVAKLMNEAFVCVKVDREERPDVDQVYMAVTQRMTGRGGWPMTVVMTPDKKPFFAGTYFPKTGRFGRYGMMELVPALTEAWKERREDVLKSADQIVASLEVDTRGVPGGALDSKTLDLAFNQLAGRYDPAHGGFGQAPKFPVPHNLRFLLRYAQRTGNAQALAMVVKTLHAMRSGGVYDHLGFGFHRYSTDREWLVPHFEKMLYDQALLAMAYAEAFQVTGERAFESTAREIFEYVLRDMTAESGAFYSAEDADSEGEEGVFYLWTPEQLKAVLGAEEGAFIAALLGAVEGGNFTDEASGSKPGSNILHLERPLGELAAEHGAEPADFAARLEAARTKLFEAREPRIHPFKDTKILTDWNGLMIAAFATAARAFDEPRYVTAAVRAADFGLAELRSENGRLLKLYGAKSDPIPGMLEDYAFFTWGLLELYETTFDTQYLAVAIELNELMLAHFWDDERGGFYLAPDDGEVLIVRSKEIYDGAIPSGNSVACWNLLRLARITADESLEERADLTMRAFAGDVARGPGSYTQLMLALDFAVGPSHEVVIAGDPEAADTRAMLAALRASFHPNKVVLLRPNGDAPPITKLAEYTTEQRAVAGKATAYVCENFTCEAPTTDVEAMLGYLSRPPVSAAEVGGKPPGGGD